MKNYLLIILSSFLSVFTVNASDFKPVEMPGTHVVPIKDTQGNKQYELLIKLPDNYEEKKDKVYPVIYFTDAVWHIEILSAAAWGIMEDVILVGVSWQKDVNEDIVKEHGEFISRAWDYSFLPSSKPETQAKYNLGQADNHIAFIREDVFEYVEKNYRADTSNRTYFGYSAGGLFGTYILMTQPDTFKNYIVGSPSLWRKSGEKIREFAESKTKPLNANVFITYGSKEDELGANVDKFLGILKKRKDQSLNLTHKVIEGTHSSAFPGTGVNGVMWLANLLGVDEEDEE